MKIFTKLASTLIQSISRNVCDLSVFTILDTSLPGGMETCG